MDSAAACAVVFDFDVFTYLVFGQRRHSAKNAVNIQVQRIDKDELCENDSRSLEVDCFPAVIAKILDIEHSRVNMGCNLGHKPLEVSEKGRIVQSPFRSVLEGISWI